MDQFEWAAAHRLECNALVDEFLHNRINTLERQVDTLFEAIRMAGIVIPGHLNPGTPNAGPDNIERNFQQPLNLSPSDHVVPADFVRSSTPESEPHTQQNHFLLIDVNQSNQSICGDANNDQSENAIDDMAQNMDVDVNSPTIDLEQTNESLRENANQNENDIAQNIEIDSNSLTHLAAPLFTHSPEHLSAHSFAHSPPHSSAHSSAQSSLH